MKISSEDAKNWVTVVSIIVGGVWVLYQWNTLFPKTESEVTISASALRARTIGEISVSLIPMPSGEEPVTTSGLYFSDKCQQRDVKSVQIRIPSRTVLSLTSNAPIPVRVEVTEFRLAEITKQTPSINENTETQIFVPDSFGDIQSVTLDSKAFVDDLRWTHVEPKGQGKLAVLGSLNLPFSCSFGASTRTPAEFAIGLKAIIQPVKIDGSLGEEVGRYFYQVCRVNADGGSTCSPDKGDANDRNNSSGFKVIAQ